MVSTHKLNRLFLGKRNVRTNSAVQGGSPGVPNPPWVAPPAGQSADRLGYDGAGRMIAKRYIASYGSPSAIVGFTTTFDRASNKLYERALHAENRSHLYEPYDAVSNLPTGGYDSLDRLLQYQRGTLSSTGGDGGNGGGSIAVSGSTTQYISLSGADLQRSYALDSLGNWRNTAFTPSTTGTPTSETEVRQHNLLNEITRINNPAATPVTINPTYDLNGNLTSAGTPAFTWDALNRLATASPGGSYYYDALNRRVSKTVSDVQTDFIYSGWRCVEDRNPDAEDGDGPIAQYVWGRYLDELLQITTLVSITTGTGEGTTTYSPGTYFPLQDMLYRTTATVTISEDGVAIVEAYDFDAYGNTLIFNAVGSSSTWWDPDARQVLNSLCQFLFTGQRFDAETGLYYYKRRYYSAGLARFVSRDSKLTGKAWAPFLYAAASPACFADPDGNDAVKIGCEIDFCRLMEKLFDKYVDQKTEGFRKRTDGCLEIDYVTFEDVLLKEYNTQITVEQLSAVRWGCSGLNILFQRDFVLTRKMPMPHEQGTMPAFGRRGQCFDSPEALKTWLKAGNMKCDPPKHLQKYIVQAKRWNTGKKPDKFPVLFDEVVEVTAEPDNVNFVNICPSGFCVGMTKSAFLPNNPTPDDRMMKMVLCPDSKHLHTSEHFPVLIWCARCENCRKPEAAPAENGPN